LSDTADLLTMQGALLAAETFVVTFYGSSIATVARELHGRVEIIRSECDRNPEAAARLLQALKRSLDFDFPIRRLNLVRRKAARLALDVVPAALLTWSVWLWIAHATRTETRWTGLEAQNLDIGTTASALLATTTVLIAVLGMSWNRRWQRSILELERKAERLVDPNAVAWVGRADSGEFAALLARQFSNGGFTSRWRFRIKLLSSPHLAIADQAVIGLVPASRLERWGSSFVTFVATLGRSASKPFTFDRLPVGLSWFLRDWQVINLAASDRPRRNAAATFTLSATVFALADRHGAVLRADARNGDPRLLRAYQARGFRLVRGREDSATVEVVRCPDGSGQCPDGHPRALRDLSLRRRR
jgi:hypothetical protein